VLDRFSRPGHKITILLAKIVQAENPDAIFHKSAPSGSNDANLLALRRLFTFERFSRLFMTC
jgi:hypothetical protein